MSKYGKLVNDLSTKEKVDILHDYNIATYRSLEDHIIKYIFDIQDEEIRKETTIKALKSGKINVLQDSRTIFIQGKIVTKKLADYYQVGLRTLERAYKLVTELDEINKLRQNS